MAIYNVQVSIVALVEADSEADALKILRARIDQLGFTSYDGENDGAFESEPLDSSDLHHVLRA